MTPGTDVIRIEEMESRPGDHLAPDQGGGSLPVSPSDRRGLSPGRTTGMLLDLGAMEGLLQWIE
jgi:hypothetical protein